ncbi:hypothetical protein [Anaerosalibacter sp. Marseille-P3206]|uniref:hypothetical protein n=1 Tax=Anaerosalibacter sp. Marseille-P3206 TaxID=1871005 RepID=UPI000986E0F4|nr:hypothetical protein [Anaerosalibacter sp. Marseille-P3206]
MSKKKKVKKYKKSTDDFMKHLKSQVKFIELSSKSYDEGFEDEAQRLATTIRVLFHDTNKSTSLLSHLKVKNNIYLLSSVTPYIPANLSPYLGLLSLKITSGISGEYEPSFYSDNHMPNKWLLFKDWWNEIVLDDKENLFSRKELILRVSNKDGGAHVDEELNESYANLTKSNSIGWKYTFQNTSYDFNNNPAYACIRQISQEVLISFDWLNMIHSYNRRKTDKMFQVAYISGDLYLYTNVDASYPSARLFEDSRVTKIENRRVYKDTILRKDNSEHIRYVVI